MPQHFSRPPVGTALDWKHPILGANPAAVYGVWLFGLDVTPRELTGRSGLATSVTATVSANGLGPAHNFNSQLMKLRTSRLVGGQTNWTILAATVTSATNLGGGRNLYVEDQDVGGNDLLILGGFDSGASSSNKAHLVYRNDGGTLIQLAGATTINDGKLHHLAIRKLGTNCKVFVDGREDANGTFGSGSDAFTDTGVETVAGAYGSGSNPWLGTINYIYVFARALVPSEIYELSRNPFCFFAVRRAVSYFVPAAVTPPATDSWYGRVEGLPFTEPVEVVAF